MGKTDLHNVMTRAGLNLIPQALSIFDADLRLMLSNRPMQQMFSLPDRLMQDGAPFDEVIRYLAEQGEYGPVGDIETFVQARVDLARAFEPHYLERTRSNGRTISVEGTPLPQGGWITVYTDITAVKQQEALLRARSEVLSDQVLERSEEVAATNRALASANAALLETKEQVTELEARTRLTAQMMPAHIAHLDLARRYTYSNRRLPSVIDTDPADIIGQNAHDALGPAAYRAIEPYLDRAYDGEATVFEFTHAPTSRRIRVAFTPDSDEADQVRGVYVLSMDVTEETQARVALQQTRRREVAAQLTSGMAHDFSNLLTIILGMQAKLSRLEPLPDAALPLIDATLSAARRGGTLLERMADVSAPRTYDPKPVRLGDLLDSLRVMGSSSLGERHTLTMICAMPDETYLMDRGHVQDALLNLILNARDAMPDGGAITIAVERSFETWLEWQITDTGTGFSEQALVKGLDPFFTTKGEDGSGLGLAMVYDTAKLAGGQVTLSNLPEGGACVTLKLPLRAARQSVTQQFVLLVEDSDALRMLVRDLLTEAGHMVLEATSVHEAETLLASVPEIGLVLTDLSLAGERTGCDLARLTALPVVLMTSLPPHDALFQDAETLGPVLRKPLDARTLAHGMTLALERLS